jgi:hypothetical protein
MTVDWDWSRVVFDHVKIGVRDAEASKKFYRTVLATLEIPPLWEGDHGGLWQTMMRSARPWRRTFARATATASLSPRRPCASSRSRSSSRSIVIPPPKTTDTWRTCTSSACQGAKLT